MPCPWTLTQVETCYVLHDCTFVRKQCEERLAAQGFPQSDGWRAAYHLEGSQIDQILRTTSILYRVSMRGHTYAERKYWIVIPRRCSRHLTLMRGHRFVRREQDNAEGRTYLTFVSVQCWRRKALYEVYRTNRIQELKIGIVKNTLKVAVAHCNINAMWDSIRGSCC
ncbi:hypothetical protein K504DRAFT_208385 [Pleomassaria siparia CBS 279.74]|uniref:Uncharacterized protein n=1 Tax=Pleomassaria siparia CBS 279.74 TaxID=1314801 RepID=A0A6G1KJ52_9PLEO|nr:hypothetical protein K504DRAFT_208385 [Pleomassaria siparia CBS 279.74]